MVNVLLFQSSPILVPLSLKSTPEKASVMVVPTLAGAVKLKSYDQSPTFPTAPFSWVIIPPSSCVLPSTTTSVPASVSRLKAPPARVCPVKLSVYVLVEPAITVANAATDTVSPAVTLPWHAGPPQPAPPAVLPAMFANADEGASNARSAAIARAEE
jgi:hypothetical protein